MIQYKISEIGKQCLEKGIDIYPTRGSYFAAGMDLKAAITEPTVIYPYDTVKIMTGIHVFLGIEEHSDINELKPQLAGLYLPRSSVKGLQLENTVGLLDCDFQGESFIKLYNKTNNPIVINPGERIAQLVIIPVIMEEWKLVESFEHFTERAEGGDGSTGKY